MTSMMTTIEKRVSVRMYADIPVEAGTREALLLYANAHGTGPFGGTVRFSLVDASEYDQAELRKLGTYGMIRGAKLYLAGTVKRGPHAMEDFGYCMELAILKATEFDLGTCWLGGSLDRGVFAEKIGPAPDEIIAAVTPVGYGSGEKRAFIEAARWFLRAASRKAATELFFEGDARTPIGEGAADGWNRVLEAVRLAPSASNRQPWRIIREQASWHLYLAEDRSYNRAFGDIRIQNLDMGIAMCHFEAAARELGLPGGWTFERTARDAGKWLHIATWNEKT